MRARILAVALLTGVAYAEESDAPQVLAPWIVTETRLTPDPAPTRATAVLPAEAWSGRAVATLADAFRQIPGAMMLDSFGGFEPPRLSIRGSGLQSAPSSRGLALLLDQLPLGLADGSFNSALLDPQLASRVEVQRGLDGWRTAPATMGGALDLRSDDRTWPTDAAAALRTEAGSFGAWRSQARGTYARDHYAASGAVSFQTQDGFRAHSAQRREAMRTALRRRLDGDTEATVAWYHVDARYDVPGPLTWSAALLAPRSVSADARRDQPHRASTFNRVTASVGQHTTARELEGGVAWGRTTDGFQQLQANGISDSRSDDVSVHVMAAPHLDVGGATHRLRVAATASRGWRAVKRWRNDAGQRGTNFADDDLKPFTSALQVEDTWTIARRVIGTAGLAQLMARRTTADRLRVVPRSVVESHDTLPQAGLRWRFWRDCTLLGQVSAVAEPPTFDDLVAVAGPYPNLRRSVQPLATQRAVTAEVGLRGTAAAWAWDVAVYRAAWRNEILRLADASGAARGAVSAGPTTHAGVEVALRWRFVTEPVRCSLAVSSAWSRATFDSDTIYGSGRLAGMPPHTGTAEGMVEFPRGTFVALGADWVAGTTWADHARRLGYGGRTLAHARAGWRIGGRWTLFVDTRNLFDHRSIASTAGVLDVARVPAATAIFLPAPGRTFTVGVEWNGGASP
ncbi:MAG: TonB-dependent receptor [Acidobacteria bacterium]|nr:TonB-dependent receptor [Acidobacteriota bacterium]